MEIADKKKIIFEDISYLNGDEWENFLLTYNSHECFQSYSMLKTLRDNKYYQPFGRLLRLKENKEIIGGYIFYNIQELRGFGSYFATRSIINGGPIIDSNWKDLFDILIVDLKDHPSLKGIYIELWNNRNIDSYNFQLNEAGFIYSDHLNYIIDLSFGKDIIFSNIRSRKRRYIKKNHNLLEIRQVENENDFEILYQIIEGTYKRLSIPLIDKSVFKNIYDANIAYFIIGRYEERDLASRIVLKFGNVLYDWYAGTSDGGRKVHLNDSMVWWALEKGIEDGFLSFNFGGAGKPDEPYGPREFKKGFKGQLVSFGRHRYTISRFREKIVDIGLIGNKFFKKYINGWLKY